MAIIKPKLRLECSRHGVQRFSAFTGCGIVLACGCRWYASPDGLTFDRTLPYREMWWEQTDEERIRWAKCATRGCRRKVTTRYHEDYWCAVDFNRVAKLGAENLRRMANR